MRVPGQVLIAFRAAVPAPSDEAGRAPPTYAHAAPLKGANGTLSVVEAIPGRATMRLRLSRETAVSALVPREVLALLGGKDEVTLEVDAKKRKLWLRTDVFESELVRDDGQGTLAARFPDQGEVFDSLASLHRAAMHFRVDDLEALVKVARGLDVDRLSVRLPKTTGGPVFFQGDAGEKAVATEGDVETPVAVFEALVAQIDPFGAKDEKPKGPAQGKLYETGPSEKATGEEPAAAPPAEDAKRPPMVTGTTKAGGRTYTHGDRLIGLSLDGPWASGVGLGLKEHETRGWGTKFKGEDYRGWVAILSTKNPIPDGHAPLVQAVRERAKELGLWQADGVDGLPMGSVLALAYLEDDLPTVGAGSPSPDKREKKWGNWTEGRRAFRFSDVFAVAQPVAAIGRQRFFDLPQTTVAALQRVDLVRTR